MGTVRRRVLRFVPRMKTVERSSATSARVARQDSPQHALVATMNAARAAWSGSSAPRSFAASDRELVNRTESVPLLYPFV
jgi:hypothetical protein